MFCVIYLLGACIPSFTGYSLPCNLGFDGQPRFQASCLVLLESLYPIGDPQRSSQVTEVCQRSQLGTWRL